MEFVGSTFKERVIEFLLILSGILFYHLLLRPLYFLKNVGKGHARNQAAKPIIPALVEDCGRPVGDVTIVRKKAP